MTTNSYFLFSEAQKKKEIQAPEIALSTPQDQQNAANVVLTVAINKTLDTVYGDSGSDAGKKQTLLFLADEMKQLQQSMKKNRTAVAEAAINASSASRSNKTSHKPVSSHSSSSGSLSSPPDFPTNDPNYPPPPFDPNDIPKGANAIENEFQNWLKSIKSSSNPNALFGLLEWLAKLQNTPGDGAIATKLCNELASITSNSGKSFAEMIVDAMRSSWYYRGGGADAVKSEMQRLANYFQGMSGKNDLFKQIAYYAKNESDTIDGWIAEQVKNPIDPDDFLYDQIGSLFDWMNENSSLQKQMRKWFLDQVDRLVARFKSNPALLITIIFTVLGGSMNDKQYQFGGYGTLNKRLSELSKRLADIQKKFADISTYDSSNNDPKKAKQVADELKKLTEEMKHLENAVNALKNMLGGTISQDTKDALDKIFSTPVGPNGKTLKDLLNDNNPNKWSDAAKYIHDNNIFNKPGTHDPATKTFEPGGPTDLTTNIQQALRTASTAYTSQAQTISVQMKTLSNMIQTIVGVIKSMVIDNYSKGWIGKLVQNQIQP